MRLPGRNAARSSVLRKVSGASVSCSMQLTMMSFSARKAASGTRPRSVIDVAGRRRVRVVVELHGSATEWIGEPTAATPRLVSTATSWTPCALSAVTAPRAVAPKPITTALSRRP